MDYMIGHVRPDWDCIGALWQLQRFGGCGDCEVVFRPNGIDPESFFVTNATAIVDMCGMHAPRRLRFDHHQYAGAKSSAVSATSLVYDHLLATNPALGYLEGLVGMISDFDGGRKTPEVLASEAFGIHALLRDYRWQGADDMDMYLYGCQLLDALARGLELRAKAAGEWESAIVYKSDDGKLVALHNSLPGSSDAAIAAGADVVIFCEDHRERPMRPTFSVGMVRRAHSEIHCGALVNAALAFLGQSPTLIRYGGCYQELSRWYKHQSGFFAGRGTDSSPDERTLDCPFTHLAELLDRVRLA